MKKAYLLSFVVMMLLGTNVAVGMDQNRKIFPDDCIKNILDFSSLTVHKILELKRVNKHLCNTIIPQYIQELTLHTAKAVGFLSGSRKIHFCYP